MSTFRIKQGCPTDSEPLATFARSTFRAAFGADNEIEPMEEYLSEALSTEQIATELLDPKCQFFLAEQDTKIVGYSKLRASEFPDCVTGDRPIELERIYVDQNQIGKGLGASLLNECLGYARQAGFAALWLGVWEQNARALAFYERFGFKVVGSHLFQLGSDPQIDLVMELPL